MSETVKTVAEKSKGWRAFLVTAAIGVSASLASLDWSQVLSAENAANAAGALSIVVMVLKAVAGLQSKPQA